MVFMVVMVVMAVMPVRWTVGRHLRGSGDQGGSGQIP
jgi:hypothetical protein